VLEELQCLKAHIILPAALRALVAADLALGVLRSVLSLRAQTTNPPNCTNRVQFQSRNEKIELRSALLDPLWAAL
jgi:hypothetical protein